MTIFRCTACTSCNYFSDRKYNLTKHIANKHIKNTDICESVKSVKIGKPGENVTQDGENVTLSGESASIFACQKCSKVYKSKRYLNHHEQNCKGIDELTCSRCMKSFTLRQHKSRHIKANNCKPRSIIHARTNIQNIYNNNVDNSVTNNNVINLNINNYGSERIDHISYEDIKTFLLSGINTIPKYIEKKHFDKDFPENINIKYTTDNKCKVYENDIWNEKDLGLLSSSLIEDNTEILLLYCGDNQLKLMEDIRDKEKLDHIKNKLILIYNKSDDKKYNQILLKLKEIIKNNKEIIVP